MTTTAKTERMCSFPGCTNVHRTYGLCMAHDYQRRAGVRLRPLRGKKTKHEGCAVEGCVRLHYALGLCQLDYARMRRAALQSDATEAPEAEAEAA